MRDESRRTRALMFSMRANICRIDICKRKERGEKPPMLLSAAPRAARTRKIRLRRDAAPFDADGTDIAFCRLRADAITATHRSSPQARR